MSTECITVYEPNDENPYGVEVAAVLAEFSSCIDLWVTRGRAVPDTPHVHVQGRLGGSVGRVRTIKPRLGASIRRFTGPLLLVLTTSHRIPLVVVWTRDAWDALLFFLRSKFGGRTFFVYHDPSSMRRRDGVGGWAERILVREAVVLVHSEAIATEARRETSNVEVVSHPPYTLAQVAIRERSHNTEVRDVSRSPRVAFVGSFRADKRPKDLLLIADRLQMVWTLEVLGRSKYAPEQEERFRASGVICHYPPTKGLSDEELVNRLAMCDLMLAPYESVTESGSVIMAITLGVPVLGYQSPGLTRLLTEKSLATSAEELADLLREFLQRPWQTHRMSSAELRDQAVADWRRVLERKY